MKLPRGIRSTYYRRGAVLWHGTASREGFRDLRGPAWLSDSREVARWFADEWNSKRPGQIARVVKFVVAVPFSLPTFQGAKGTFETWLEKLIGEGERYTGYDAAEDVCDAGYVGWRIVNNYASGDDIMLCEPERWLRRVPARSLWRP